MTVYTRFLERFGVCLGVPTAAASTATVTIDLAAACLLYTSDAADDSVYV